MMLLTISTTHSPATDLGYLLHKNPARVQTFDLAFGTAHVFYPQADPEQCTAVLMLEIDPVGLVRRDGGFALAEYVNDRPYVASSFLSVAIAQVYGSALNGHSRERPELVETAIPIEAVIAALPVFSDDLVRKLFEPLGYAVDIARPLLDDQFPEWGSAEACTVTLHAAKPLRDVLSHLYVLIPVLDNEKHYYVDPGEIEKLLRHGERWLAAHPERELIAVRYLKYQRSLTAKAMARLSEGEAPADDEADEATPEAVSEARVSLHTQRLATVREVLRDAGAATVADLGCGEGRLLRLLAQESQFTDILGMDVSHRALEIARDRLDRLPQAQNAKVRLLHGALTYKDARLSGFDAAALVEVIEHLDEPRLAALERVVFEAARPGTVVVTTPNAEYNVRWETLPVGQFRHPDHRFEWTRAQFQAWADSVAARFGYVVQYRPVGDADPEVGAPSQMAVFSRKEGRA